MEQGQALLPEMRDMGVWEPKGLIFELFLFESWSNFAMLLHSRCCFGN